MSSQTEQKQKKKLSRKGILIIVGVLVILCICGLGITSLNTKDNTTGKATSITSVITVAPSTPSLVNTLPNLIEIPFQIIREWEIPNGGYGRTILIDPKYKNESDLKKLGDQLVEYTKNDRNAFIFIYDDKRAAELQENIGNLNDSEQAVYDQHFIGRYFKNANTGVNELAIILNGIDSDWILINY
jgi:hypothetical protein